MGQIIGRGAGQSPAGGRDNIECPEELGPRYKKEWDALPIEKKKALLQQIRRVSQSSRSGYHPGKSLHKALFDPNEWQRWIHPELLAAIQPWRSTGKFSDIDLSSFAGCKVEAPGIVSFPAFTEEFCDLLLAEVKHYHASGMPNRAPNSMNNYGLVLNEIGMRPVFDRLLREVFVAMGAILFGDDADRIKKLHGVQTSTENWGGSTLDDHHSFVVLYKPAQDKHLDMHIDECDVTFNFGITTTDQFEGNDLTFCGMFDSSDHRKYHHTYKHQKSRCVVHSGKRRHGALDITSGERASLIMWTKSTTYRGTMAYQMRNMRGLKRGEADRVCLSYTHDPDYKKLMPKHLQYHMVPKEEGDETSTASTTASLKTKKSWMRVCADADVKEGNAQLLNLEAENEQVAVFRHHGELFALDNRCSHMGGPLCDGDIEDLASHAAVKSSVKIRGGAKKEDGVVKCPRHGMCFNLRTGENIEGGPMKQRLYPVRVTGAGDVEVEVDLLA